MIRKKSMKQVSMQGFHRNNAAVLFGGKKMTTMTMTDELETHCTYSEKVFSSAHDIKEEEKYASEK